MGVLYESGAHGVFTFLFLSVVLGGAASAASGRAVAQGWRPLRLALFYAALIAFATSFLHYALFGESVLPLDAVLSALGALASEPARALRELGWSLRGWAAEFVLQGLCAAAGFHLTRARQMKRQYAFLDGAEAPPKRT